MASPRQLFASTDAADFSAALQSYSVALASRGSKSKENLPKLDREVWVVLPQIARKDGELGTAALVTFMKWKLSRGTFPAHVYLYPYLSLRPIPIFRNDFRLPHLHRMGRQVSTSTR